MSQDPEYFAVNDTSKYKWFYYHISEIKSKGKVLDHYQE
jgi:hypothetical protein